MITFTWTITSMKRDTAPEDRVGGVIRASWNCIATDGTVTSSGYGEATFTPDPLASDYTPYADLTQAQVLGWCWGTIVDKNSMEAFLQSELDKKSSTALGVPWPVDIDLE